MHDFSQIGRALRRLRLKQNLRQADLAKEAGITAPMLSAYETGKQRPSFATLDKLIAALHCEPADLADALSAVAREKLTGAARARAGGRARGPRIEASLEDVSVGRAADLSEGEQRRLSELLPGMLDLMRRLKQSQDD